LRKACAKNVAFATLVERRLKPRAELNAKPTTPTTIEAPTNDGADVRMPRRLADRGGVPFMTSDALLVPSEIVAGLIWCFKPVRNKPQAACNDQERPNPENGTQLATPHNFSAQPQPD
jgi:hypothetical protein